jgi:hypothetical protein
MKRAPTLIVLAMLVVLPIASVVAQQRGADLQPYLTWWKSEQVDSVREALPQLSAKFPKAPEVLFWQAVFDVDGERAVGFYRSFVQAHPGHELADEALYRVLLYEYALGQYKSAREQLERMKENYPRSVFLKKAAALPLLQSGLEGTARDSATGKAPEPYILQLGAFSQMQNATELKAKLDASGFRGAVIDEKVVNQKRLYVVKWGSFATKDEAQKGGDALKSKLAINYLIVENK